MKNSIKFKEDNLSQKLYSKKESIMNLIESAPDKIAYPVEIKTEDSQVINPTKKNEVWRVATSFTYSGPARINHTKAFVWVDTFGAYT